MQRKKRVVKRVKKESWEQFGESLAENERSVAKQFFKQFKEYGKEMKITIEQI
jgi:uncharacterized protein (UPF0303 family)